MVEPRLPNGLRVPLVVVSGVSALGLLAAGCGKPEDTTGYVASPPTVAELKTPPPPVPAFVAPMMGRPLMAISKGTGVCKGALDTVRNRYTGAKKGAEIEGWGWDEHGARPLADVLFVDPHGVVVGGATVGNLRPDVPKAMPEVKTEAVGWKGMADVATDTVQAVGLTADGATCVLGQTKLG